MPGSIFSGHDGAMEMRQELPAYRLMEVSRALLADDQAPARSRELIRECFHGRLDEDKIEELELLVTELVTNSLRHAGIAPDSLIQVRAYLHDKRVRIEVHDGGRLRHLSQVMATDPRESGYGLQLVEQLSTRWGVHVNGHTQFWFELDL